MSNEYVIVNGELKHYGVVGMKWGKHKAQKYAKEAAAYRKSNKEWEDEYNSTGKAKIAALRAKGKDRKADKVQATYDEQISASRREAERYESKSALEAKKNEHRAAVKDVYKNRSAGAKLATNILAGPFANRTYNSVIAAGGSKNLARATTAVTSILGGSLGHVIVSAAITSGAGRGHNVQSVTTSAKNKASSAIESAGKTYRSAKDKFNGR